MCRARLSRSMALMHAPSLLTPAVAATLVDDHANAARIHRSRARNRLFGRRRGASRILAPRGRLVSPGVR